MSDARCACLSHDCQQAWPVYAGRSFNLWNPDTGDYYDSACGTAMTEHLSAPSHADGTLPCQRPRIAFRDVTNPTNTRTMVCALVPGARVAVHKAPYLRRTGGGPADEAYVLGVLSSVVFDWQIRRTVELNMTFGVLGDASVPDPGGGHPVRDRVTEIAALLAAADDRFSDWADTLGVPVGTGRIAAGAPTTDQADNPEVEVEPDSDPSLSLSLSLSLLRLYYSPNSTRVWHGCTASTLATSASSSTRSRPAGRST